jgi:predicted neutral ceramidase superfamily lipid hydrolase
MNAVRDISITTMKAVLVTVVVVAGFGAASALGVPAWLQGVFLVPAMLVFCRLSGHPSPSIWKLLGFASFVSVFAFLVVLGSKNVPRQYWPYYYLLLLVFAPVGPILNWFDRRFFSKEPESRKAGTGQPASLPVVEPKGGDKPQPEAKGRAR